MDQGFGENNLHGEVCRGNEEADRAVQEEKEVCGPRQAIGEQPAVKDPHRDLSHKSYSEEQEEGPALDLEDYVRRGTME